MKTPMTLSPTKQSVLTAIVNDLQSIEHIEAITLGGSFAMGMANENSDLDIGIYYYPQTPFKVEDLKAVAEKYNANDTPVVTDFYQWGAWLDTTSGEVDLLYRNINQVQETIVRAIQGQWENDFAQQPPFGFSSVIYLAEIYYGQVLYDPCEMIRNLKTQVASYPEALRNSVIQQSLWAAQFSLWQANKFAQKQDMYNTLGCMTRSLKNIVDTLLAINKLYSMGDKNAIKLLKQATYCPQDIEENINTILSASKETLTIQLLLLQDLFEQVVILTDGKYQPYFVL